MLTKLSTRQIYAKNQQRNLPEGFAKTIIWLPDIRSMHNVGSAFRTADAFGIRKLILSGYTPTPPRTEISKTALGADEFVDWQYFPDNETVLDYLKSGGLELIALEQTSASIPVSSLEIRLDASYCLVYGNEISGVDEAVLRQAGQVAEIPQYGRKHSFNISVTVGISLFALHEIYINTQR
jgi:23S rRNA (guanosine2251-2'-O)-methyltransferase